MLLFLLAVVVLLYKNSNKVKERASGFRAWKTRHRAALDLCFAQATVAAVTIQTVILMSSNHEEAGGKDLPQVYVVVCACVCVCMCVCACVCVCVCVLFEYQHNCVQPPCS